MNFISCILTETEVWFGEEKDFSIDPKELHNAEFILSQHGCGWRCIDKDFVQVILEPPFAYTVGVPYGEQNMFASPKDWKYVELLEHGIPSWGMGKKNREERVRVAFALWYPQHIFSDVDVLTDNSYNKWFKNCTVTIPEGIEYIKPCSFMNCNIKSIKIPSTCKVIGKEAFDHSTIGDIIIPETTDLLYIQSHAFRNAVIDKFQILKSKRVYPDVFQSAFIKLLIVDAETSKLLPFKLSIQSAVIDNIEVTGRNSFLDFLFKGNSEEAMEQFKVFDIQVDGSGSIGGKHHENN